MKTKVYVFAYSSHEDYEIYGVYSSREKAEARKKIFSTNCGSFGHFTIDEFEIDNHVVKTQDELIEHYEALEAEEVSYTVRDFISREPQI